MQEQSKIFAHRFTKKASSESFAQVVHVQKVQPVYFLQSTAQDGRPEWFIIAIEAIKEKAFLKALKGQFSFELKDFGDILYSGYGDAPPESIQYKLIEEGIIDP